MCKVQQYKECINFSSLGEHLSKNAASTIEKAWFHPVQGGWVSELLLNVKLTCPFVHCAITRREHTNAQEVYVLQATL